MSSLFDIGRMQRRMHNKLLIADGAFAVVGGRNIADDYFQRSDVTRFLDLDALVTGALLPRLSGIFDRYWNSTLVYPLQDVVRSDVPVLERRRAFDERVDREEPAPPVTATDVLGHSSVGEQMRRGPVELVWARAEAMADPPDKAFGSSEERLREHVRRCVREATLEVAVTTPYLVPGTAGMETMRLLRERGVSFTMVTNSLASTDVPTAYLGYMRYRTAMLQLGVEIYEVVPQRVAKSHRFVLPGRSRGRLHAKSAVIDRRTVFIGSMNLDPRSDQQNTEMGVFVDSPELAHAALTLLEIVKRDAAYELRLDGDGAVVWIDPDPEEGVPPYRHEPETSGWTRFLYQLLNPFVPEGLL
jgi:putative cardiolipin synthase